MTTISGRAGFCSQDFAVVFTDRDVADDGVFEGRAGELTITFANDPPWGYQGNDLLKHPANPEHELEVFLPGINDIIRVRDFTGLALTAAIAGNLKVKLGYLAENEPGRANSVTHNWLAVIGDSYTGPDLKPVWEMDGAVKYCRTDETWYGVHSEGAVGLVIAMASRRNIRVGFSDLDPVSHRYNSLTVLGKNGRDPKPDEPIITTCGKS